MLVWQVVLCTESNFICKNNLLTNLDLFGQTEQTFLLLAKLALAKISIEL
jgi:hypothetical protein